VPDRLAKIRMFLVCLACSAQALLEKLVVAALTLAAWHVLSWVQPTKT